VEFVRGSVLDADTLRACGQGVDFAFHLAGVVGMRLASSVRELAYGLAETGTRNLLEATDDAPVVLFSSSAVYGLASSDPVAEGDAVDEDRLVAYDGGGRGYAAGKMRLEELGRHARAAGRRVLTVRPFNVVGPRQTGRYGMVVPTFVRLALADEPLEVFDDGLQQRCFSAVGTFIDCLLDLVAEPRAWTTAPGAFNVGSAEPTSFLDLARHVIAAAGSRSELSFLPYDVVFPGRRDVRVRVPDVGLMESLIGPVAWPSIRSIVHGLLVEAPR
jgi:UDP-glucose 4-epimerase